MVSTNELLNDSQTAIETAMHYLQSQMWTAMPGIIQGVNSDMTVTVQPAIKGVVTDENGAQQLVNLPILINCPVVFPSAGGFALTLPITTNDEVLIVFASRCIDAWWQSSGIQKPMEMRMHDLSDGFVIPGIKSKPNVIANISSTEAQLRNDSGDTYLAITGDGKVKLVAPAGVEIDGNLTVGGLVVGGADTVPISLTTHTHTSATPGNPTSPPLP